MMLDGQFSWDIGGSFVLNTCYSITDAKLSLVGILNSKLISFIFSSISAKLGNGAYRWIRQYVEQIPVPHPTPQQALEIELLVDKILNLQKIGNAQNEILALEREIDKAVYRLYDLSPEEIALVEGR